MDPTKEQGTPEPSLSLEEQIGLVQNSNSPEGLKTLGDALIKGRLDKLFPLKLNNPSDYVFKYTHWVESGGHISFDHEREAKFIWIAALKDPEKAGVFRLQGCYSPKDKSVEIKYPEIDRRTITIDLDCEYVAEPGKERIRVRDGHIYFRISNQDDFDVSLSFDEEGNIQILPPQDYFNEKDIGETFREMEAAVKNRSLPPEFIPDFDWLETSLREEGATLKHQAKPGEYDSLRADVAEFLGIPMDKLMSGRIDPVKTFAAIMEGPIQQKPAIRGKSLTSVPPVILASA